ncbi:unnamed protein product, partial [Adineta steineri]
PGSPDPLNFLDPDGSSGSWWILMDLRGSCGS